MCCFKSVVHKRSKTPSIMSELSVKMILSRCIILLSLILVWTFHLAEACSSNTIREQPIDFVWNVPTSQCLNRGVEIQPEKYGIRENNNQLMTGDVIVIFYNLGQFPFIDGNGKWQFGGVPQNGNLEEHLFVVEKDINDTIPDADFQGLGVIDFESWRPVWAMAAGTQAIYRNASITLVERAYPDYNQSVILQTAANQFEQSGRKYMIETLNVCKRLRPNGKWGYYGYPMVDNYNKGQDSVSSSFMKANDQIEDLFGNSTALFPSIYIFKDNLTSEERALMVEGRINETLRIRTDPNTPIYPYFWFSYHEVNEFLTSNDLLDIIGMIYDSQSAGMVIWGGSSQVNTVQKCGTLKEYVDTLLGPIIEGFINCTAVPSYSGETPQVSLGSSGIL